jgi:carboxymethylenebutenolidase
MTDTKGLDVGEAFIPVPGATMSGYFAKPAGGKNLPTILVVQEIFGVHEHIKDVCRRLAKAGYLAVAPELYQRQGNPNQISDVPTILSTIVSKVPDAQVMGDLDATVAWATQNGFANQARLGITGFCWGGRIVWLYAAHSSRLKAGAAWYGRLVGVSDPLHPKQPVDVAGSLKAPVLGLYGGADAGIPVEHVEQMRVALKAANDSVSNIVVYDGAPHAFYADYRPSYRKEAAEDGWKRMREWFTKYGVA